MFVEEHQLAIIYDPYRVSRLRFVSIGFSRCVNCCVLFTIPYIICITHKTDGNIATRTLL